MGNKFSTFYLVILFLLVVFIVELIYFKDLYLVVSDRIEDFSLKNFLVYNLAFKIIGYVIKFLLLYMFFKFILLIFDFQEKVSVLKILLLCETLYLLILKGSMILYFLLVDTSNLSEGFLKKYEINASLSYWFGNNIGGVPVKYLFSSITVFDIFYVFALVVLFAESLKTNYLESFKKIGLSYISLLIFVGLIKVFIAL